jgi:hypothetical protein
MRPLVDETKGEKRETRRRIRPKTRMTAKGNKLL